VSSIDSCRNNAKTQSFDFGGISTGHATDTARCASKLTQWYSGRNAAGKGERHMNVKEMLLSCDIEQAAALHFAIQEPPACEDWEGFLQAHRNFLEEIADITPIPSDNIALGIKFRSGGRPYSDVRMYCKSELMESFQRCEALEEDRQLETYSDAELEQIAPEALDYVAPEHYDMELLPWEKMLGVEVFEENLRTVGHNLLAALVIREMSFWGLSHTQSQRGQHDVWEHLQEAMQEVDPHQYTSVEELMEALETLDDTDEYEMSVLKDVPSGNATINFLEFSSDYWARAAIARYRELLRYVASNNSAAHPMLLVCAGVEGVGKTSFCGVIRDAYAHIMETVLSATDIEQICKARQDGFYIRLVYLGLNTPEEHLLRIQNRVAKGGADADPDEVARQFQHRFSALTEVLSLCHEAAFYDCTNSFCRVAEYRYSQLNITQAGQKCMWLNEWLDTDLPEKMVTVWSDLPSYERIKIIQVIPNDDFSLTLSFSNGEYRRLDMKPHLKPGTVDKKIMCIEAFRRVYLDGHAVCWDIDPNIDSKKDWRNAIDLCPDWCYFMSVPCAAP